mgnify:CR=1 FL=1
MASIEHTGEDETNIGLDVMGLGSVAYVPALTHKTFVPHDCLAAVARNGAKPVPFKLHRLLCLRVRFDLGGAYRSRDASIHEIHRGILVSVLLACRRTWHAGKLLARRTLQVVARCVCFHRNVIFAVTAIFT